MSRKITRDEAATQLVRLFFDYGLPVTEGEALQVINLFEAFQSRYRVGVLEGYQRTGCTAQALPGTNGGFTTAVFTGSAVPEGTELFVKMGEK